MKNNAKLSRNQNKGNNPPVSKKGTVSKANEIKYEPAKTEDVLNAIKEASKQFPKASTSLAKSDQNL